MRKSHTQCENHANNAYVLAFPLSWLTPESGLYYNVNRYYDPAVGRYTQHDPIGAAGGLNPYAYVGGNPLYFVDSDGLKKIILLPPNDPNYPAAANTPDDPDVCLVISHGSPQSVNHMNAKQLNKLLSSQCKPKQTVKLDACRTGQGENSIAEQLAKLRKAPVVAPDERTWTTPWGTNFDTPYPPMSLDPGSTWSTIPDLRKPGSWRTF